jgi:hypothetical protein
MTSQIVSSTLDEDFPVAGQDNDSQGFRDNFSVIKTGLETAASEISVLQETTAQGVDYDAELNKNDFLGGIISNVQLSNAYKINYVSSVAGINIVDGDYFKISKITDNNPISITWPDNENENYIKVRIEVSKFDPDDELPTVIAFESSTGSVKANFVNITDPAPGDPIQGETIEENQIAIFDCWIAGADTTMFVQHIHTY